MISNRDILKRLLLTLIIIFSAAITASATSPWEETSRPKTQQTDKPVGENDDIEVIIKDGWIYITATKSIQIKIFTILGQQISAETLQAGTHRMHLTSRGIYILKTGTITRRIVI